MRSIRLDQWLENRAPGGVLAPMRILERMECGGVAWLGNRRLSARGYLVVARQDLWRKVEPEELGVPPTRLLPDSILLVLVWPKPRGLYRRNMNGLKSSEAKPLAN